MNQSCKTFTAERIIKIIRKPFYTLETIKNKMKKLGLFTIILLITGSLFAQSSQKITLEDIFVKGTFQTETVRGLHSMNDGEHYTTQEGNTNIV